MDAIAWGQLIASILGTVLTCATLIAMFWGAITASQDRRASAAVAKIIDAHAFITGTDFSRAMQLITELERRVSTVEKFDVKLGILDTQQKNMQEDISEIKTDVKALDSTITGAIMRAAGIKA